MSALRAFPAKKSTTSTPADEPAQGGGDAAASDGGAESEQASPAAKLMKINFDDVMARSSAGLHKGTFKAVSPTKSGNGITVGVEHEDGSYATLSFNMFRTDKTNGVPRTDADGNPVLIADIQAQKAYGNFCKIFDITPQELTRQALEYAAKSTPDKPVICGVVAKFDFAYSADGNFLNWKYNDEATRAMQAEEGAAA